MCTDKLVCFNAMLHGMMCRMSHTPLLHGVPHEVPLALHGVLHGPPRCMMPQYAAWRVGLLRIMPLGVGAVFCEDTVETTATTPLRNAL